MKANLTVFFIVTSLLQIEDIEKALKVNFKKIKNDKIALKDFKIKFKILKEILSKLVESKSLELKLKRK